MAKRETKVVLSGERSSNGSGTDEDIPGAGSAILETEASDEGGNDEIAEFIKANSLDGGTVRLYRKGPTDTTYQYCNKFMIADFDMDHIKTMYGGGAYRGDTYKSNGQKGKPIRFDVDFRHKGTIDLDAQKAAAGNGNGGNGPVIDPLKMFEIMKGSDTGTMNLMMQMMNASKESSDKNMMLMMTMMQQNSQQQQQQQMAMTQMMVAMISSMGNRPVPVGPDNTPVMIELIRSLGSGKGGSGGMKEAIEAMVALKAVMGGGSGDPDDDKDGDNEKEEESFGAKLLKAFAPMIIPAIGGMAGKQPRVAAGVIPATAVQPVGVPAGTPAVTGQPSPAGQPAVPAEVDPVLSAFMLRLVTAAENDSDPGLYHDLIVDSLPADKIPEVEKLLKMDDWLEQIYGSDPDILARVKIKGAWFNSLREMLIASFSGGNDAAHLETGKD